MPCPLVCAFSSAAWVGGEAVGKGTLSDGCWLSAFQGRLINFEKRRKVSTCSACSGAGARDPAVWDTLFPTFHYMYVVTLDTERRGNLSPWGLGQEGGI